MRKIKLEFHFVKEVPAKVTFPKVIRLSQMQDHHQQEQETTLSLIRYSKLLKSYSAAFDAMKKECS